MTRTKIDIPPDEQLVVAIKNDDRDAFRKLYCRYFKSLLHFAWYRLYSMDNARDLVQETFYRIWVNRDNLSSQKSIKAYLYRTLTNLIINYRKLYSTSNISIENISEELKNSSSIDTELQIDLLKSLDQLPVKLRTVYELSRFDGFNYAEIAEICNISVKAVEKRMSKAFQLLRKTFSKKYFE